MDRFFKKKNTKKKNQENDSESSNKCSGIDEEIDFTTTPTSPVRPNTLHPSKTWPRLPELALTTSEESHAFRPVDVPGSPIFSATSSSQAMLHPDVKNHQRRSTAYTSTDNEVITTDSGSESDTVDIDHRHPKISFDDSNSMRTLSKLPSLNNDHHKTSFPLDDSAANTLVEAALDKDEAKDRHVRFQDHVTESAALVQRMLGVKMGHHHTPDPLGTMMQNRHNQHQHQHEEEVELQSPHQGMGGGSVLASLMKLEAKRHDGQKKKKHRKNKKVSFYNKMLERLKTNHLWNTTRHCI